MAVIPSNAHKFIDDRYSEDRRVRRTTWFDSKVYSIATQSGQSGEDGNLTPKREDVIRALNAPEEHGAELKEISKKFFDMLDALVLGRFKKPGFPKDQMLAGCASVVLAPDYVIHCSGDNQDKLNYVSVLAGNKVLKIKSEDDFEIQKKEDKVQIFVTNNDKSEEAKIIRSKLMSLDTLAAVEKLDGQSLRRDLPELNQAVKDISARYGNALDLIEAEISYFMINSEELKSFNQIENGSAAPDKVANVEMDLNSLADFISRSEIQKGRVRLNLNSNSELETVDVLCEAVDTEEAVKEPDDCMIVLMNDHRG